jgi:hypothetical protein
MLVHALHNNNNNNNNHHYTCTVRTFFTTTVSTYASYSKVRALCGFSLVMVIR